MGLEEAKNKTLEEIIDTEDIGNEFLKVSFMKLVDAKIGIELSDKLANLTHGIESNVDRLINSNKELSKSNSRYAKALCWLTGGLVLVGLLPYIEKLIKILINK